VSAGPAAAGGSVATGWTGPRACFSASALRLVRSTQARSVIDTRPPWSDLGGDQRFRWSPCDDDATDAIAHRAGRCGRDSLCPDTNPAARRTPSRDEPGGITLSGTSADNLGHPAGGTSARQRRLWRTGSQHDPQSETLADDQSLRPARVRGWHREPVVQPPHRRGGRRGFAVHQAAEQTAQAEETGGQSASPLTLHRLLNAPWTSRGGWAWPAEHWSV